MQNHNVYHDILQAYLSLKDHELQLFLRIRSLPRSGTHHELATRLADYDAQTYKDHFTRSGSSLHGMQFHATTPEMAGTSTPSLQPLSNLPIDLITEIMDHIGSWELSKAVGAPTSLQEPSDWTSSATVLDRTILSTSLRRVMSVPLSPPFTKLGTDLLIRFELIDILDYLWNIESLRSSFKKYYGDDYSRIPKLASAWNRTSMLHWWFEKPDIFTKSYTAEAIDDACRYVCLSALHWWDQTSRRAQVENKGSPLLPFPPRYTSQALESASHKGQISVLSFFLAHGWPLLPGRSLDMASSAGHVDVLNWWAYDSGLELGKEVKYDKNAIYNASCGGKVDVLQWWKEQSERPNGKVQMVFDNEALTGATRHNKPEVLDWWDKSGLPISYRICDIEEALEDAIGGGTAARQWWARKGVNFRAGDSEWMKLRSLN